MASGTVVAAEWPASLDIAGFTVSGIRGTAAADGSGRAAGRLAIPGGGSIPVDLSMTASGVVTGSSRAGFTSTGVRMEGSFLLDRRGLQGTGTIITRPKPITDANIAVTARGVASGRGRVSLGPGLSVPVTFDTTGRAIAVRGTSPCQSSADTPLALYTFRGTVELTSPGGALKTAARGTVERRGKIGGMVTTFGPMTFGVDAATGDATLNVGGTSITLELW